MIEYKTKKNEAKKLLEKVEYKNINLHYYHWYSWTVIGEKSV